MRKLILLLLVVSAGIPMHAADNCMTIHGRARYYGGDGQLRIWHIGTQHEFEPDTDSWDMVVGWLDDGAKAAGIPPAADRASMVDLFGDFRVCPTEPFKMGSVQHAKIISVTHRHYVSTK